ncbi:MAG TPA: branched-chain amino acid transport system II carrier protein [Pseudogracilibacillus sp.]|nr:branched-chain amino acid transport system II carrier protein [Pseudogracilibacillus sp.]
MSVRNLLILGFMLFSLFFGAGNLIFPPFLGMESGNYFIAAISGFILTAVFIPFLAVLSVTLSKNGLLDIGRRVSPLFGLIFTIIVYLSIGALYGIPRAASVAYELGFVQVFARDNNFILFLFTVIFFAMTYILSIDPKKMVERIGKILTPALILVLTILFVRAFFTLTYEASQPDEKFIHTPFLTGFLEGYFTMDAIAALAFGIVVVHSLQQMGVEDKRSIIKGTAFAGTIAAICLTIVYLSLSWIGRVLPITTDVENGADILVLAADTLFGRSGSILFGLIVILACLTTCVGLTNACATFFHERQPKVHFKSYVAIFAIIGLLITNLGLNTILSIATPILVFIYPFAIVLIFLAIAQVFIGESKKMYVFSICLTATFAIHGVLDFFEFDLTRIDRILNVLPLHQNGLGWVLPAITVALIGYIWDKSTNNMIKE